VIVPVKLDFETVRAQIVRSWARGKSISKISWGRDGREVWALDGEGRSLDLERRDGHLRRAHGSALPWRGRLIRGLLAARGDGGHGA
jgi:hypothetical protein